MPYSDPEAQAASHKKWREANKEKRAADNSQWVKDNPAAHAKHRRDYVQRVQEKEAGRPKSSNCEVCGSSETICYDHDHATGKFAGWLCNRCNRVLGFVGDDVSILTKLIAYLKETRIANEHSINA